MSISDLFFPNDYNLWINNLVVSGTQTVANQTVANQTVNNLTVTGLLSACAASPGGIQTDNITSCSGTLTLAVNQLNLDIISKINLLAPLSIQGTGPITISVPIITSNYIQATVSAIEAQSAIVSNSFMLDVGTASTINDGVNATLSANAMIRGVTTFTGTIAGITNPQNYATGLSIISQMQAGVPIPGYVPAVGTMFTFIVSNQTTAPASVILIGGSQDGGKVQNAQPGTFSLTVGKNAIMTGYVLDPTLAATPSILIYGVLST
jgi:hypothetical protein